VTGPRLAMCNNQIDSRIDVCDEKCHTFDEEEIQRNAVRWTIYSCDGQQSIQTFYCVNLRNVLSKYWKSRGKNDI